MPPQSTKCPAGFLCFFLTVADGDALANFTRLDSPWWGTRNCYRVTPITILTCPKSTPFKKKHGFWQASHQLQTNLLKSLSCIQMWDERGLKRIFSECWKYIIILRSKACTADDNPSVEQPERLLGHEMLQCCCLHPFGMSQKSLTSKISSLKWFKSMLQQKTVLSYNKNHTLLDSIILVGCKPMISNGFHFMLFRLK